MKRSNRKSGFTLVEILIVVVIMAILAAAVVPQFSDSASDAKASNSKFNLHSLRSQIETYRAQHYGVAPTVDSSHPTELLYKLTVKTNADGDVGTTADYPYGPYLREIPENPFTRSQTVKAITTTAPVASDVDTTNGWIYNQSTGNVWINSATLLGE